MRLLRPGRRIRWLKLVAALMVGGVLTACQANSTPAATSSITPVPSATAPAAAAAAPIAVTVAPALLAPGAVRTGTPAPTVLTPPASTPSSIRTIAVRPRNTAPCTPYPSPKQIPLQVSTGFGTATISWLSDGDTTVASYRVSAISQQLVAGTQPAHPTVTIARGPGCAQLRVTLAALGHRVPYVFWLEEARVAPGSGSAQYTLVGRSSGVLIP